MDQHSLEYVCQNANPDYVDECVARLKRRPVRNTFVQSREFCSSECRFDHNDEIEDNCVKFCMDLMEDITREALMRYIQLPGTLN